MPKPQTVSIDISDIRLTERDGNDLSLAELPGVHIVVLVRHRH